MKRTALILAIAAFLMVSVALAQQQAQNTEEIAVRKMLESYVQAYNRADTQAMASHWGAEGTYVSPSADVEAKGPKQIQEALTAFFAKHKGSRLNATVSSVQFSSPDSAVVKGVASYGTPEEPPEDAAFVATLTKEKGVWKLSSVEEEESAGVSEAANHLKELAWLIGEWEDRDENASVDTTFSWAKNLSFISGSFAVNVKDRAHLEGTQVIGWDPVRKQLRSWLFDSSGSFGEGTWSRDGDRWVVKVSSVLSTGEKASSVNIYTPVDADSFTWKSIGREVGGELLPNIDEVTVVRKPTQGK
jgi:uncharacterized protein (TIGR02246 family)